jgi:hypothetical protein
MLTDKANMGDIQLSYIKFCINRQPILFNVNSLITVP